MSKWAVALVFVATFALAWRQAGILLTSIHRPQEGKRYLERAVTLAPDDFEAHKWLSGAHYLLGDRDLAIEECRAALRINPRSEAAARNLATFGGRRP
jgi:tetratricopeptide (TPR) repeat protein